MADDRYRTAVDIVARRIVVAAINTSHADNDDDIGETAWADVQRRVKALRDYHDVSDQVYAAAVEHLREKEAAS